MNAIKNRVNAKKSSKRHSPSPGQAAMEALETRAMLTAVVVNTIVDAIFPPGSGTISLRSAIATANSSATPTTITFDPTVFATPQTIGLNGTQLELSNKAEPTTISGPAAGVTISGRSLSCVFQVDSGVTANFSSVALIDGNGGQGGGLDNNGTVTLTNTTISASTGTAASECGGGLFNSGSATLIDSTLSGDTAVATAFSNFPYGVSTNAGGALFNSGTVDLTNVTITGNTASADPGFNNGHVSCSPFAAGGVFNSGSVTLLNVTISANTASASDGLSVGGIYNTAAGTACIVMNTIVAGDTGGTSQDANGAFDSLGYNLVGIANGSTGFNGLDLTGTTASPLNAELGPLADNGGLTQTLLPLTGSPAIGHGNTAYVPAGITTDQRGLPRIVNGKVDIGAVEVQAPATPTITWITPAPITYGSALTAAQEDATANVPGSFVYNYPLGTVLHAGTTPLTATFTPTDTINYTTASKTDNLVVNQAPLTVAAANKSRVYNTANPSLTYTLSGFVNGDTSSVVTGTASLTTTATTSSTVGTYSINVGQGTLSAADYSFTPVNGTLTITQATPVITWNTPAPITYGTALGAAQENATANVPGVFSYSPAAGTVLHAGTRSLAAMFTPTDTLDYATAPASVNLVVNQAPLTVTANNQSKTVNTANPPLTYTLSGFVNSDTSSVVTGTASLSTTATTSSTVGTYPINVAQGSLTAADYSFGPFVPGSLVVSAAPGLGLSVNSVTTYSSPGGVQSGFFDVVLNVPSGSSPQVAGYQLEADVSPASSGLSLTGASEPANALFSSQTPTVFQTGNALQVTDSLPNAGQANPAANGEELVRIQFQVQAGLKATFTISLSDVVVSDGQANAITLGTLTSGTITVLPDTPPAVKGVSFGSTQWASAFPYQAGYPMSTGAAQLTDLPWINLNQVSITFSEAVNVTQGALTVTGVNLPTYTFSAFSYNPSTFTATWTFAAPIAADKLALDVASTGAGAVTDVAGSALDGEWTNGSSAFPSGNGLAGGDFVYDANVLPGDVTQAGGPVNVTEVIKVRNAEFTTPGSANYSPFYDVDGSGSVNILDVVDVRNREFTSLPSGTPVASASLTPTGVIPLSSQPAVFSSVLISSGTGEEILPDNATDTAAATLLQSQSAADLLQ